MCGIAGIWNFRSRRPVDRMALASMSRVLRHRGPDGSGLIINGSFGVAHQRLAVIDAAGGRQPWIHCNGRYYLAFNGEIYNHKALRAELQEHGVHFRSRCDTEVIPWLYDRHGYEFLERLEGMFAIALWDATKQELLLARDRLGEKPLIYMMTRDGVAFASECQALAEARVLSGCVRAEALDAYVALGFIPHEFAIYKGVTKVPPGACIRITADGRESCVRYWSIPCGNVRRLTDLRSAADQLYCALAESVTNRLEADVPLGVFLSGGLDSSLIAALCAQASTQPIRTFCVVFGEEAYDERAHARTVAHHIGACHHEIELSADGAGWLPMLMRHFGEPFADPSAIATYGLCQAVSQEVTVAIGGDGADELLLGYRTFTRLARRLWLQRLLQGTGLAGMARRLGQVLPRRFERLRDRVIRTLLEAGYPLAVQIQLLKAQWATWERLAAYCDAMRDALSSRVPLEELMSKYTESWRGLEDVDVAGRVDLRMYLPDDILAKVDITSMACSLEVRSPYLATDVVDLCCSLPVSLKLGKKQGKVVLRELARRLLPIEIAKRRKHGFAVPVSEWLKGELYETACMVLRDPGCFVKHVFDEAVVEQMLSEHRSGERDHGLRLWSLLCLAEWADQQPVSLSIE